MPYAVTLRLEPAAAAAALRLQQALADSGIADDTLRLGYQPHVTLAVLEDSCDEQTLRDSVARVSADWLPVSVDFASLGVFPANPAVVFIAPAPNQALMRVQAALCAALPALHTHYRPGHWVPHVTLSQELRESGPAVAALARVWRPFSGTLDRIDLLRFRPVEILWSRALAAA
jgi:2'-5' RNA ligase